MKNTIRRNLRLYILFVFIAGLFFVGISIYLPFSTGDNTPSIAVNIEELQPETIVELERGFLMVQSASEDTVIFHLDKDIRHWRHLENNIIAIYQPGSTGYCEALKNCIIKSARMF